MSHRTELPAAALRGLAREALAEDVGAGDATTLAIVPPEATAVAELKTRQACTVAGMPLVQAVFAELDPEVSVDVLKPDGSECRAGTCLAVIRGRAQPILTGERTALNYLQRLSGIATLTRQCVTALGPGRTKLLDTRKTTPGLRLLEKYAVSCGGGENHRFGLYDRILIKDNHLELARTLGPDAIARAVAACRRAYPQLQVELEVETLDQVDEALDARVEFILLDNMSDDELREAVQRRDRRNVPALIEASGGITLARLPLIAATGVDFVSMGALTHSAPAVDIGLDCVPPAARYPQAAR